MPLCWRILYAGKGQGSEKKCFFSPILNLKCYPKSINTMQERLRVWGRNARRKRILSSLKIHEYDLEASHINFFLCAKD